MIELLFACVIAFIAATCTTTLVVTVVAHGSGERKTKRPKGKFPASSIEEAKAGRVQLRGRARAIGSVDAPTSEEAVIGAIITVASEHDLRRKSLTVKTIVPFDLDDGSGCAQVEVDKRTSVSIDQSSSRSLVKRPSPELERLLRRSRAGRKLLALEGLVVFERVIRDGDLISVWGLIGANDDGEVSARPGYRSTHRKRRVTGLMIEQRGVQSDADAGISC